MLTLSTALPVSNLINLIRRLEVLEVRDERISLSFPPEQNFAPSMSICVRAYGAAGVPYGVYWLRVSDSGTCTGLDVNATPTTDRDQLKEVTVALSGTPYTTLAGLFWANVSGQATPAKHIKAVEDAIKYGGAVQLFVNAALAST